MAVCGLRTVLLIVYILQLIVTIQRQVLDFLGYMWLPIIVNFLNILLIIFGSFGAVQYITKYLMAYSLWTFVWLSWNFFLICYYLNLASLNRESGLLSLGTGSVSWWEGNGWGCQSVWGEIDGPGSWRPTRVEGCLIQWHYIELGQSSVAAFLAIIALPLTVASTYRSLKRKPVGDKKTLPRRPVYTIELSPTEATTNETSVKPMTPRRVKRRSGSRGNNSSVRRSRRSYRNAAYLTSTTSLPRDGRPVRPTSAHSSYSNFHAARPASYHAPEAHNTTRSQENYEPPPPTETVPILTKGYDTIRAAVTPSYDVAGPYNEPNRGYDPRGEYDNRNTLPPANTYDSRAHVNDGEYVTSGYGYGCDDGWEAPPPPAPPYSARATPQAPGPPTYQASVDNYHMT